MKYIDINAKFTAAVSSYIAQGYIINTASMSGSQGEVAHIDLTNGKQIVRVLLDSFTEWEDCNNLEGLKLVVGIATDDVKPNDNQRRDVIWNNRLDVISCERFYKLSSNRDDSVFYGTREEATAADEKRFERYCRRDCRIKKHLPEKASPLVIFAASMAADFERERQASGTESARRNQDGSGGRRSLILISSARIERRFSHEWNVLSR